MISFVFSFIGTIRLQLVEHYILEAHPDDSIPDLRLDRPLKSFIAHCDSINFNNLTREEHLHLPSLIILYKSLFVSQDGHKQTYGNIRCIEPSSLHRWHRIVSFINISLQYQIK